MKVCHVGTLSYERMGTLTHAVVENCIGEHEYVTLDDPLPDADVYVLECFKKRHDDFVYFKVPEGAKLVSFVHSSSPCVPSLNSDEVVCLTHWSASEVADVMEGIVPRVIPGCVGYSSIGANYASHRFGRITRNALGKFHPQWDAVVDEVLFKVEDAECVLYENKLDEDKHKHEHERLTYDTSIQTHDWARKSCALSSLSLAVFAHGDFIEVFPVSVLECMAAGLPIVYLYQPSMHEMIGEEQVCCSSIGELREVVGELLLDVPRKSALGLAARRRAAQFTESRMIAAWDDLLREVTA